MNIAREYVVMLGFDGFTTVIHRARLDGEIKELQRKNPSCT